MYYHLGMTENDIRLTVKPFGKNNLIGKRKLTLTKNMFPTFAIGSSCKSITKYSADPTLKIENYNTLSVPIMILVVSVSVAVTISNGL